MTRQCPAQGAWLAPQRPSCPAPSHPQSPCMSSAAALRKRNLAAVPVCHWRVWVAAAVAPLLAWAAAGCLLPSLRTCGAPGGSCGASSSALGVVLELCALGWLSQAPSPVPVTAVRHTSYTETAHTHTHTRVHVWNTESGSEATLSRSVLCFRSISFEQANTRTRQHSLPQHRLGWR